MGPRTETWKALEMSSALFRSTGPAVTAVALLTDWVDVCQSMPFFVAILSLRAL